MNLAFPVITRFIRVVPLQWNHMYPCLKLELYGCLVKGWYITGTCGCRYMFNCSYNMTLYIIAIANLRIACDYCFVQFLVTKQLLQTKTILLL